MLHLTPPGLPAGQAGLLLSPFGVSVKLGQSPSVPGSIRLLTFFKSGIYLLGDAFSGVYFLYVQDNLPVKCEKGKRAEYSLNRTYQNSERLLSPLGFIIPRRSINADRTSNSTRVSFSWTNGVRFHQERPQPHESECLVKRVQLGHRLARRRFNKGKA